MEENSSNKTRQPILSFDHTLKVEVYEPEFEPLSLLEFVDQKMLENGKHTLEIGSISGGCCKKVVFAIIENGMVVNIRAEGCTDVTANVPEEITTLFSAAVERLKLPKYEPVSVADFLSISDRKSLLKQSQCYWVCVWRWCVFCCDVTMTSSSPMCWIETRSPGGPVIVIGGNP